MSRSRTRAKDLTTPSREVRVPTVTIQPVLARCRPYLELLPDSFVSHTTAAEIHGIHLPPWIPRECLDLSRGRRAAAPRRKGVVGHRLDIAEGDVVKINGLAVTSVARTWLDLATVLPFEDLVIAGDQIVSAHVRSFGPPKIAMVIKRDLGRFVATHGRSWGIQKARLAYDRLRVGVDSPPETSETEPARLAGRRVAGRREGSEGSPATGLASRIARSFAHLRRLSTTGTRLICAKAPCGRLR